MHAVGTGKQCSVKQSAGRKASLAAKVNASHITGAVQRPHCGDAVSQAWMVRGQKHSSRDVTRTGEHSTSGAGLVGARQTIARASWRDLKSDTATTIPVTFKIHYKCTFGQNLYVTGSLPEMGKWDADKALLMKWEEGDMWSARLNIEAGSHVDYKYLVKNADGSIARWQEEGNVDLDLELPELTLYDTWARESRYFDWHQPAPLTSTEQVLVGDVSAGTPESRPAFREVFAEQEQAAQPMDGSIIELAKAWLERNQQLEPVEAGFAKEEPQQKALEFQAAEQQEQAPAQPRRRWGRFEKAMAAM